MKILTLCEGGNVRSVGTAYVLRQSMGHDAIPASFRFNTQATLNSLCDWAEKIIVMLPEAASVIPKECHGKVALLNIGPDRFGAPFHPDLLGFVGPRLGRWFANECPSGMDGTEIVQL